MTLRALVTRPEEDAAPLAAALAERGIEVTAEPLLTIRPVADAVIDLSGVQALLFTSANGVRAFAGLSTIRDLPVFAVGDATAATAREHGFAQVESASGDVAALARLVQSRLNPSDGALFHAAGSAVAGDLAGLLEQSGFALRRQMLYEAKPAEQLSPATVAKLANGELDLVLFFSPRTAATFVMLARAAGEDVVQGCGKTIAICLSPAVAAAAGELSWRDLRAAARPELPALLDLIDAELAAQARSSARGEPQAQPASGAAARTTIDPAPPIEPPPRRSRLVPILVTAAVTAAAVTLGAELLRSWWSTEETVTASPDAAMIERLSAVEKRVETIETAVASVQQQMTSATAETGKIRTDVETLQSAPKAADMASKLDDLEQQIAALRTNAQQPAPAVDLSALTDRIAALEARVATQSATAGTGGASVDSAALEKLAAENAALREQVAALAAQIDSFKGIGERLNALDRAVAARPGDGGATLVLAVSNLGAALATARPFAAELGAVTQIASSDPALGAKVGELTAPIAARAPGGIPTLVDLRARFDDTARAIVDAAKAAEPPPVSVQDKDWLGRQLDWLSSAADYVLSDVSVRPVGDVPGEGPGERVARAEVRLSENALGAAIAELEGLTGPAAEAAAPAWRFAFCGTVPDLATGGRCPPPCPMEPGLSSRQRRRRLSPPAPPASGRPVHSEAVFHLTVKYAAGLADGFERGGASGL